MNKKTKSDKLYITVQILAVVIILSTVMFLMYTFLGSDNEEVVLRISEPETTLEAWKVNGSFIPDGEDGVSLNGRKGEPIILEGVVPDYVADDWGAMVYSDYCDVKIYVNDLLIYSYADNSALPLPMGRTTGNIRLIAPILKDMAGGRIVIIYTPYFNMPIDIMIPAFENESGLVALVLRDNLFRIAVGIVIIVAMIIGLALYVYQQKHINKPNSYMIEHFVGFSVLSLLWLTCSSDLPQFVTNASESVSLVSFIALSAIAIPFNGFCEYILGAGKKIFRTLWMVGWILPLMNLVCFVTGICDPMELLYCTHAYIIVSVVICFFFSVKSVRSNTNSKLLIVGMGVLIISVIIGLILFYTSHNKGYDGIAYGVGFIMFFIIMVFLIGNYQFENIAENKFLETYKDVAYKDVLTGLENRTAIVARFGSMTDITMTEKRVSLFLFNMNGLHSINDNEGHDAGDVLLVNMAECIRKIFSKYGSCYRVGGDEMAVVLIDMDGQEDGLLKDFNYEVELINKKSDKSLSVSYGYVTRKWYDSAFFFRDIYRDAYANMQENRVDDEISKESSI